ncbi:Lrp/AsnC family transcriptional regulator [Candidatus Woesearchaeota archaeon]|nr:Lrp/AsnC family transcriptional regulator [Candidatus Woesearchaeota archaeon]
MPQNKNCNNRSNSINLGALGYKTYRIYFRLHHCGKEAEFIKALQGSRNVIHLLKTEGRFDYAAAVAVSTVRELDDFLTGLKNKCPDVIADYRVAITAYSRIFKLNKLLLGAREIVPKMEKYSGEEAAINIDDKDKALLRVLSQAGNLPIVELARRTKLSLDVVKYRVKQLSRVVLSYRAVMDMNKLGYYHYVFHVRTRRATRQDEERLLAWCAVKQNVLYVTKHIGYPDFAINVAIQDIAELNAFLEEMKHTFADIIDSYETIINTELLKLNYVPF